MMDYDAVSVRADTVMKPDPMSDAAVEAVARAFCKRMGLDPDEVVGWEWKSPEEPECPVYEWECRQDEAREAIAMHLALKEVLG